MPKLKRSPSMSKGWSAWQMTLPRRLGYATAAPTLDMTRVAFRRREHAHVLGVPETPSSIVVTPREFYATLPGVEEDGSTERETERTDCGREVDCHCHCERGHGTVIEQKKKQAQAQAQARRREGIRLARELWWTAASRRSTLDRDKAMQTHDEAMDEEAEEQVVAFFADLGVTQPATPACLDQYWLCDERKGDSIHGRRGRGQQQRPRVRRWKTAPDEGLFSVRPPF